jgi:hypothetical protein
MFMEVVRTPGESHESNSVGFGVVGLTRSHSRFLASASGSGSESSGMVVVPFVELDEGVTVFFELHADRSKQLTKVTRDNFFKVTFFTEPLLFK